MDGIPHPQLGYILSKLKVQADELNHPMAYAYQIQNNHFANTRTLHRFGVKEPCHSEKNSQKRVYLNTYHLYPRFSQKNGHKKVYLNTSIPRKNGPKEVYALIPLSSSFRKKWPKKGIYLNTSIPVIKKK